MRLSQKNVVACGFNNNANDTSSARSSHSKEHGRLGGTVKVDREDDHVPSFDRWLVGGRVWKDWHGLVVGIQENIAAVL